MGVTEQLFQAQQVTAVVQIMDSEAVAHGVGTDTFGDPGSLLENPDDVYAFHLALP
jgi:hypothetical protein